jgi:hypothetical protein
MGAYSSTHRPTISGGKPNSRVAWGLARLNAFLYKIDKGKSRSGKYSQDNDLIDELGYKYSKFEDGGITKSQLLAPNGKTSNLTPEQYELVRKPEFKSWFGDWENDPNENMLTDENGEPLVWWHTGGNWNELNDDGIKGKGKLMFSPTKSSMAYGNDGKKAITRPFFIKSDFIYKLPYEDRNISSAYRWNKNKKNPIWFVNAYGGFIVVRQSNQIKLADGTNTTFDANNPDIRFADGGLINNTNMKEVKKGGITYGPSHANGGIPVKNKSTNEMLEVEGGEGITNKHVMASDKTVKLNGKEMTLCEAVSAINQMEGNGVKFNCDDVKHKQFIQEMAEGGELERGTRTEEEHIQVLRDLYAKKITPEEATEKIAKDHLKEDSDYYTKLAQMEGKMRNTPRAKVCGCGCSLKRYDNGGRIDSLGYGSFEDMVGSFKTKAPNLVEQKKELIELTLSVGRQKVDTDFKPDLMKNTPEELHKYWEGASHVNLYKYGWRLQFTDSREFAGLCSQEDFGQVQKGNLSKDRNLYLSINFVKSDANWKNNYLDTILHECAHAIVREMIVTKIGYTSLGQLDPMHITTQGHGKIWKMVCEAINPSGDCGQFYTNAILENSFNEYHFECQNCEYEGFGKTKAFTSNCPKCFKPVIIEKNL